MYPESLQSIALIDRNYRYVAERPANRHIPTRALLVVAVDNLPPAGGTASCYRPQESPAKRYINHDAGDAGGILHYSLADTTHPLPLPRHNMAGWNRAVSFRGLGERSGA